MPFTTRFVRDLQAITRLPAQLAYPLLGGGCRQRAGGAWRMRNSATFNWRRHQRQSAWACGAKACMVVVTTSALGMHSTLLLFLQLCCLRRRPPR